MSGITHAHRSFMTPASPPTAASGLLRGWSGTARRLLAGFGALVAIFAASSWLALAGLSRVHDGLQSMKEQEQGVRLSLELASAVRDQYAHQAHTIIIGDESHLGFYEQAATRVREITARVRARAPDAEARAWVDEIESSSRELDVIFRERIVPAVVRGEREGVQAEHAHAQLVVTHIQELSDKLVGRFEAAIDAFQADVTAVERRTFVWMVALLLGAPLLAAAVTIYVGRSIAVPLGRLQAGAARLAEGDLDARIAVDTPDEFGDLARQWNAMTAALKDHQQQLVRSEKLAGIGRLAAGVAHEINNPLGVILGYVRLLRKRAQGPLDDDLRVVEEETLRCKEIVDGLLDLSRPLSAGREPVDLREVCDEVVARLGEARLLSGVRVTVDGGAAADGHPLKLRQVLANLVRNAAEAAGDGGTVALLLRERDGAAEVEVVDSGPGIGEQARGRLFEPFFTTKEKGTGLGLAVSRAIARAHGGDVEAASAPGGGARFTLRLPRRALERT
jgi:two-component system, NtrC family, sensor kinase